MALLAAMGVGISACASGETGSSTTPTADAARQQAIDAAKAALAARLGVGTSTITVVKVEVVQWPDTSLGVPEPGKMYAQVIVPGFRITLAQGGKEYEYHAGKLDGKMAVVLAAK